MLRSVIKKYPTLGEMAIEIVWNLTYAPIYGTKRRVVGATKTSEAPFLFRKIFEHSCDLWDIHVVS